MTVSGGDIIFANDINALTDRDNGVLPQGVIKRGRRITTTGSVTTTETGVLRIDSIPVYAGRLYRISTNGLNIDTSVDNDAASVRIRASTSGSASITSTLLGTLRTTIDSATQSNILPDQAFFVASADGTLSVLLSLIRISGTGNIVIFCDATNYLDMVVEDMGLDPGDTGVVI